MNTTEAKIIECWPKTETPKGCRAFIDMFAVLEAFCKGNGEQENYELVRDARDLAHTRGNIMIEEQREKILQGDL